MKTDGIRVVIMEDEEAHFMLMERAINRDLPDALIYHFDDAESFVQRLNQIQPDVILADYLMPGMNGIDFLAFLNRENIAVPFVMITGQGDEKIAVQAMKAGAADYLVKSKDFFKLLPATIEKVIRERNLKKSLHESERLNQLLMDSLPHPAMLIRADRTIVAANQTARKIGAKIGGYCWRDFGQKAYISDEDMARVNDHGEIPPEGVKCTFCLADEAASSQAPTNAPEVRAFGKIWDTWWIPVERDLFFHYALDITDSKQREKELSKERDFIESLVETAPAIILLLDSKGRIVRLNRYMEELSGFSLEEVKGKNWFDTFLPESDHKRIKEIFSRSMHGKVVHGYINPILTKGGEVRPIEWHGTLIRDDDGATVGLLSIGLDITKKMRAERALRESEEKYRGIVETAGEGIWIFDKDAKTTFVNRQMAVMLGYEPHEMVGKSLFEFTRSDFRSELEAHYVTHQEGMSELYDFCFLKKDGSDLWAIVNIRPLFEDGQFCGSLGMLTDISSRRVAEEALRESEQELRFLSSRLLSAQEDERKRIARELHDGLSSSLVAIKMSLESMRKRMEGGQAEPQMFDVPIAWTQQTLSEARRLMTDLRPLILDDLGLRETLNWFLKQFQTICPHLHLEKKIQIEEAQVPEPLKIVTFRIVQEAFNNILKYSKAQHVHFSLLKSDGRVELLVEDDGIGFDLGSALRRKSYEGGLGLASMRERAKLAGGELVVASTPGEGTRIQASWPCIHSGS